MWLYSLFTWRNHIFSLRSRTNRHRAAARACLTWRCATTTQPPSANDDYAQSHSFEPLERYHSALFPKSYTHSVILLLVPARIAVPWATCVQARRNASAWVMNAMPELERQTTNVASSALHERIPCSETTSRTERTKWLRFRGKTVLFSDSKISIVSRCQFALQSCEWIES